MKNLIVALAATALFAGCAMKQKIMDVSMVSMTHTSLPEGSTLVEKGPVTGKFCANSNKDKGTIGLFDEAIRIAQTESGADFISSASFFSEGSCVSIEGTGQKIASAGAATSGSDTPKKKK